MGTGSETLNLFWKHEEPQPWSVHGHYRVVASNFLQSVDPAVSEYDPLTHRELVSDFAKLHEGDEKALVQFAQTWGLLGWSELAGPKRGGYAGDPLPWIWGHLRNVHLVLELYEYLRRDDNEKLAQILGWRRAYHAIDGRLTRVAPKEEEGPLIAVMTPDGRSDHVKFGWREPGSLIAPLLAEDIICTIINRNLQGQITYAVFPEPLRVVSYSPAPLTAIYWHLARIVTEDHPLARCEECDALFFVTHRRQRFCPPPPHYKGSLCGAKARDRRRRQKKKEG